MNYINIKNLQNVKYITFNRNEKRNAINDEMSNSIVSAIEDAEKEDARVIILQADESSKVFSAGYDLSDLNTMEDFFHGPIFKLFRKIRNTKIPIIAKINGAVYAGALHLLMVCDIVLATDLSPVTMTLNKMGIPFDVQNYKYWLDAMGIHKVKELFFTAQSIDANDAYVAGIFNYVDTLENINLKLENIIQGILNCSSQGIANSKMLINKIADSMIIDNKTAAILEKSKYKILKSSELSECVYKMKTKII